MRRPPAWRRSSAASWPTSAWPTPRSSAKNAMSLVILPVPSSSSVMRPTAPSIPRACGRGRRPRCRPWCGRRPRGPVRRRRRSRPGCPRSGHRRRRPTGRRVGQLTHLVGDDGESPAPFAGGAASMAAFSASRLVWRAIPGSPRRSLRPPAERLASAVIAVRHRGFGCGRRSARRWRPWRRRCRCGWSSLAPPAALVACSTATRLWTASRLARGAVGDPARRSRPAPEIAWPVSPRRTVIEAHMSWNWPGADGGGGGRVPCSFHRVAQGGSGMSRPGPASPMERRRHDDERGEIVEVERLDDRLRVVVESAD